MFFKIFLKNFSFSFVKPATLQLANRPQNSITVLQLSELLRSISRDCHTFTPEKCVEDWKRTRLTVLLSIIFTSFPSSLHCRASRLTCPSDNRGCGPNPISQPLARSPRETTHTPGPHPSQPPLARRSLGVLIPGTPSWLHLHCRRLPQVTVFPGQTAISEN